jgi:hypothetical protein
MGRFVGPFILGALMSAAAVEGIEATTNDKRTEAASRSTYTDVCIPADEALRIADMETKATTSAEVSAICDYRRLLIDIEMEPPGGSTYLIPQ